MADPKRAAALLCATVLMYLVSLALTVVMYLFFMESPKQCWQNPMFITLNVILCFIVSIASIHPKLQEKNSRIGLLQAAVVTAYTTYLVWSALSSQPASMGCSSFPIGQPGTSQDGVSLFFGVAFTFLAVIYSALRVSTSDVMSLEETKESKKQKERLLATLAHDDEHPNKQADPEAGTGSPATKDDASKSDEEDITDVDDNEGKVAYNYSFFHLTFLLAAMYLGMVLTNWQSVSSVTGEGMPEDTILVDQGMSAVWVKIISSWVTLLLYMWTIFAPVILPDRKFWD